MKEHDDNFAIAKGLRDRTFTSEVSKHYLGEHYDKLYSGKPALLITDAHPNKLTNESMRLLVPLNKAETKFEGFDEFFYLLADFARNGNIEFLDKFQNIEDGKIDSAERIFEIKPGAFGIAINVRALIDRYRK